MNGSEKKAKPQGPRSLVWLMSRETVLLLGGRRALLLQVAHPLVAEAVADHSAYREDPFGRLLRTLDLSYKIAFGDRDDALSAIERVNATHRSVSGTLKEAAGSYPAGTPYHACDPDLLLWVHATLIDTTLTVYERFVRRLTQGERDRFYLESNWATEALGIPPEMLPPDFDAFASWWDEMLTGGRIAVSQPARLIAESILYPRVPRVTRRIFDPLNTLTIGLLPASVRESYGLRWNRGRAAGFKAATFTIGRTISWLPSRVRYVPHARRADERVEKG